jgi:hypothetical protein
MRVNSEPNEPFDDWIAVVAMIVFAVSSASAIRDIALPIGHSSTSGRRYASCSSWIEPGRPD